jgi:DNA mismatch repair protein MutS
MQADKTTLNDLSIFHRDEEQSIFHHLNFTTTIGGREYFRQMLSSPFSDINKIKETQRILHLIRTKQAEWPHIITNGTVMVIEKFFETAVADIPRDPNPLTALSFRFLNASDYSLIKYSVRHFLDFAKGMLQLVEVFNAEDNPPLLRTLTERMSMLISKPLFKKMSQGETPNKLSITDVLNVGYFLKRHYKPEVMELINIFSKLDAYYGMAMACKNLNFTFPEIEKKDTPYINGKGLFHLLLPEPVSYNVELKKEENFLFLTGANMAGKSTFIKAVGVSVYLAHIGMGVPAESLSLSMFDGLLSNIQVEDNLLKGESYFFNEVKRVKKTIEKINDGRNWLILIDELFKGTNVQDAMKCSTVVIEGLRKLPNALFVLSTHLYEIGEDLRQYPNIKFSYFETHINDGQLIFSYQLKDGISNDRLGYLILKREGVINMLESL